MALLTRTRILQPVATRNRVVPVPLRSLLPIRQHIGRVAAVEQQETAYQPELSVSAVNSPATDVPEKDFRIEELDAAQEELLSWMLFWDGAAQEKDLDEMQDYEELTDQPEFDGAFELEVEDMLEKASETNLRPGQIVTGTVYEVDEDGAYVEIGAKSAGFVPLSECSLAKLKSPLEVLRPGMQRDFVVVEEEDEYGEIILSLAATEATIFWDRAKQLQLNNVPVFVTVQAATKGGLVVSYEHVKGFIPISQLGQNIDVDNLEDYVGYELPAKFVEIDESQERVLMSHRRVNSMDSMQNFTLGDVVTGVVSSTKPYGAFLDIGGILGLLHISQITHERLTTVDQVLQVGDKMKVMILSMDKDRGRVTLSTKKLEKEPGDMLRDPQLVFEGAEAMAAAFKERVNTSEGGFLDDDMAAAAGAQGGNDGAAAPGGSGPADASGQQQYAFDTNP